MRRVNAHKRQIEEPAQWVLRHDKRGVFHEITSSDTVIANNEEMELVGIRNVTDINNPGTNVAILVGSIVELSPSGKIKPQLPELWYWGDKFWVKAITSPGNEYYRNKKYLLYSIDIIDEQEFFEQIVLI